MGKKSSKNEYQHIERLYTRKYKNFLFKTISVFSIYFVILMILILFFLKMMITKTPMGIIVSILLLFLFGVGTTPFITSFYEETRNIIIYPSYGLKKTGKVLLNKDVVLISMGRRIIKTIEWQKVVLIEKYREDDENIIVIITPDYLGRARRDEKYINYIELPCRKSIEDAIIKFSKLQVVKRKPEEYIGEYYDKK